MLTLGRGIKPAAAGESLDKMPVAFLSQQRLLIDNLKRINLSCVCGGYFKLVF